MFDHVSALIAPDFSGLISILNYERRLLEQILYRQAQATLLIAAGEHRFVPNAVDEVESIVGELAAAEVVRAAVTEVLAGDPGTEPTIEDLLPLAPAGTAEKLEDLRTAMDDLLSEIDRLREIGHAEAEAQRELVARMMATFDAEGYDSSGSPRRLSA